MCKYCEKKIETRHVSKWVSTKHPHYREVEEKIVHNPIWIKAYVPVDYEEPTCVEVYLDVDTNRINGQVKINYCPFCGRKLEKTE